MFSILQYAWNRYNTVYFTENVYIIIDKVGLFHDNRLIQNSILLLLYSLPIKAATLH